MKSGNTARLFASAAVLAALAGCETITEETTEAVGYEYTAMLTPAAGGTGSGKVEISLNDATNTICSDVELTFGVNMTSGGLFGPGNTLVSTFDRPDDDESGPDSEDCDDIDGNVLDAIRANPGAYTARITATTGNLSGALRSEG